MSEQTKQAILEELKTGPATKARLSAVLGNRIDFSASLHTLCNEGKVVPRRPKDKTQRRLPMSARKRPVVYVLVPDGTKPEHVTI